MTSSAAFSFLDRLSDVQLVLLSAVVLVALFLALNALDTRRIRRNAAKHFGSDHQGRPRLAERDPSPPRRDLQGIPTKRSRRS